MAPITLLAGDLGGTKTLLATYQVDGSSLIKTRSERYASGQWPDFRALLAHFLADCEVQPSAGCLAGCQSRSLVSYSYSPFSDNHLCAATFQAWRWRRVDPSSASLR